MREGACVEPCIEGSNLIRSQATLRSQNLALCVRIACDNSRLMGIADLIGSIQSISVPRERNPGRSRITGVSVVAVHDEQRETGCHPYDTVNFPITENCINRPIPSASELLAFAKRKFVTNACYKLMVHIQR
jgi:hypothetical protein